MITALLSLFLSAIPPEPLFFKHHHQITHDDADMLHSLTFEWRSVNHSRAPILFANNYYDVAEQLRHMGLRAYSMTIALSVGHLRGLISELPIQQESLAVMVLMQKTNINQLLMAADAVSLLGCLLVRPADLPEGYLHIFHYMGFQKMHMFWHDHQVFTRKSYSAVDKTPGKLLKFRIETSA